jgi:prolyl 4-hydroxylase
MFSKGQTKENLSVDKAAARNVAQSSGGNNSNNNNSSQLLVNILVFIIALLIGVLVQQHLQQKQEPPAQSQPSPDNVDLAKLVNELSGKLKSELLAELNAAKPEQKEAKQEDSIVNEKPKVETTIQADKVVIEHELKTDDSQPEIRISDGKPIVLNQETLQLKPEKPREPRRERKREELREEKRQEKSKIPQERGKAVQEKAKKSETTSAEQIPDEVKNFKAEKISQIKPKKMWIPIPNSNGGHRRVPPIEVKHGKEHGSSVKIWLFEEFLSKEECEQLIQVHDSHLKEYAKEKPIICFDSVQTLKKHLVDLNREKVAELVTPLDFTEGTMCLNQTFSRQLQKWGLKWSFSTAFYPGESKFSHLLGKRIEEATQLNESHGGKFQITSYPFEVGYKDHTDCVVDSSDERDRYATFLVYLNDLGADGGGETLFPELGVDIKPREARALTWTNMNYATGKCEAKSTHKAAPVTHPVKKKYIIQRWYYLKNFYTLGKRVKEANLPQRSSNTPKISCDQYDFGSCRMYDEWGPDHLIEYMKSKKEF